MLEAIKKFAPQNFNDLLCLILIVFIAAVWAIQGLGKLTLSAEVTGALIVTWTLLVQYYFRKKQSEETDKPSD
jgi:ABC-type bacteriocin/lantibiotic exporter with double-glycine peptidase domain